MIPDTLQCPGCGAIMDLSPFEVRPDQVICPRCNTRTDVAPLAAHDELPPVDGSTFNDSGSMRPDEMRPEENARLIAVESSEAPEAPLPVNTGQASFNSPARMTVSAPAILPIDAKGNAEPLAISIIGFFSTLTLFPLLGLVLCAVALSMLGEGRRCGTRSAYASASSTIAVIGIVLNCILLIFEVLGVAMLVASPTILLGRFGV